MTVLLAGERRLDVEKRTVGRVEHEFLAYGKIGDGLESIPVLDETVLKDAFRVAVLFSEGLIKINLVLLPTLLVHLDELNIFFNLQSAL